MGQILERAQKIGRYRILSELGRGSMGRVYLAEDPNIGRKVALKVFSPEGIDPEMEEEFQQRFVTEAKAAGRLNHPGIVTVYDAGTDPEQGITYIAMEWVEGKSLHEILWRRKRLSVDEAVEVVAQAALALDYAHGAGVIHRDVKPANILVDKIGRVRLMDFGVAKLGTQALTLAGVVLGTPAFMSPEQIRSQPVDGRSDIFSLGAVLYVCLTGVSPFEAETIAATTFKVVHDDVPSVRTHDPAIPEELASVVEKALRREPGERFQTGIELARALAVASGKTLMSETMMSQTVVSTATPGVESLDDLTDLEELPPLQATVFAPKTEPAKGSRGLWAGIAVAILAALGLGAVLWTGRSAEPVPQEPARALPPVSVVERPSRIGEIAGDAEEGLAFPQEPPPTEEPSAVPPPAPAPPPAADPAPPEPRVARALPNATVEVIYVNRLRECQLSVSIDGVELWSREVTTKNFFKRAAGHRQRVAIPVVAGRHSIEVRLTASDIDAAATIEGAVEEGATRQLRVSLERRDNELELEWTE